MKKFYISLLLILSCISSLYSMEKPENNKLAENNKVDANNKVFQLLKNLLSEKDKEKVQKSTELMKKVINERITDLKEDKLFSILLMNAFKNPYVPEEILELLIKKTKNVHNLLFFMLKEIFLKIDKMHIKVFLPIITRILNLKDIDFNEKTVLENRNVIDVNMTLLMLAFKNSYISQEVLELLINKTKNIYRTTADGYMALHRACAAGNLTAVSLLLKRDTKKISLHAVCNEGNTPLHVAAYGGHSIIVDFLIEAGAKINTLNKVDMTPLYSACTKNRPDIVETMLKAKANPNVVAKDECRPVIRAVMLNSLAMLKMLVDSKADIMFTLTKDGNTLLHLACLFANADIVEYLVGKSLNVNVQNHQGETSAHFLAQYGKLEELKILEKHGANFSLKNELKLTPLQIAANYGFENIVEYLVDSKNVDVATLQGGLAMSFSGRDNAEIIIKFFLDKLEKKAELENKNKNTYIYSTLLSFSKINQNFKQPTKDVQVIWQNDKLLDKYIALYKPQDEAPVHKKKKKNKKRNKNKKKESESKSSTDSEEGDSTPSLEGSHEQHEEFAVPLNQAKENQEEQSSVAMHWRITRWQDPEWVQEREKKAASPQKFQQDLVCHQLPEDLIDYVEQHGNKEERKNVTYAPIERFDGNETCAPTETFNGNDPVYSLYGEIIFNNAEDNPWKPGKKRQGVLYECTKGWEKLFYHANAKPCSIKKKKLDRTNAFERQLEKPQRTLRVFLHKEDKNATIENTIN